MDRKILITAIVLSTILITPFAYAVQVGGMAPDFGLTDQTGSFVTLGSLKGKVVFLSFWAPWCASCREELPDLDKLHRKYAGNGFTVLSVSVDPSESDVEGFLRKHPVSFPVMIDQKGAVADVYRFSSLPTSFLIGRDGIVRYIHKGYGKEFFTTYDREIHKLLQNNHH